MIKRRDREAMELASSLRVARPTDQNPLSTSYQEDRIHTIHHLAVKVNALEKRIKELETVIAELQHRL